ncbi:MAG: acyl-ACP--UDP-N-acetylglucosamine O-acyltransferase [Rhizobiaceae bacterium]
MNGAFGETAVHSSSVIEPGAKLGAGVRIGPFCHVSGDTVLGDGVELISHVSVQGRTSIGARTVVGPQTVLGGQPQNFKHKGSPTDLVIGSDCTFRENVTIHLGSDTGHGRTVVGDNCYLMAYAHIAHDCIVGNNIVMANCATLGGHCEVGDNVSIGGLTAVHQFVRVGHHAFVAGCSALVGDLIPYGMAMGNRAGLRGFNIIGMKRSGFPRSQILVMREAYRAIFESGGTVAENAAAARATFADNSGVVEMIDFLTNRGKRIYCMPNRSRDGSASDDGANEG